LLTITISMKYDAPNKEQVKKSVSQEFFNVDYPFLTGPHDFRIFGPRKIFFLYRFRWCSRENL